MTVNHILPADAGADAPDVTPEIIPEVPGETPAPELPHDVPAPVGEPPPVREPEAPRYPQPEPLRAESDGVVRSGQRRNLAALAEHRWLANAERRAAQGVRGVRDALTSTFRLPRRT